MIKKIAAIAILLICLPTAMAAITEYTVPTSVPLNKNLTIYGIYSGGGNTLCSFFIFDTADQQQVIIRLSDEYTISDGSFYSEIQITEPLFRRGFDFNAVTKCGSDVAFQLFYVEQKEDLAFGITPEGMRMDFQWWTNSENTLTIFLAALVIIILAFFAYGLTVDVQRITAS